MNKEKQYLESYKEPSPAGMLVFIIALVIFSFAGVLILFLAIYGLGYTLAEYVYPFVLSVDGNFLERLFWIFFIFGCMSWLYHIYKKIED